MSRMCRDIKDKNKPRLNNKDFAVVTLYYVVKDVRKVNQICVCKKYKCSNIKSNFKTNNFVALFLSYFKNISV